MTRNAKMAVAIDEETFFAEAAMKFGLRHESGAWFNHRVKGLLVKDPLEAMAWESEELAGVTAAMVGLPGRFEAVPLPV